MESPSLLEAARRFPGALIRLPSAAVDTLDAINALTERVDRLVSLLEQFEGGVTLAGSGVDFATSGFTQAVAGLQQAVGALDNSRLPFSSPAALRNLAERLSSATVEVVTAEADDEGPVSEEPPFLQLDVFVGELARLVEVIVCSIPGVREFLRVASPPSGRDAT